MDCEENPKWHKKLGFCYCLGAPEHYRDKRGHWLQCEECRHYTHDHANVEAAVEEWNKIKSGEQEQHWDRNRS